ncbi:MAG: PH domain-containing protein [Candidatus Diapherotrites archaeon]|nr:PH domain-containing protein [Candidatus Diapherotrites archaeon]
MADSYELKPNRTSFVTYGFAKISILLLVIFAVIHIIANAFFNLPVVYPAVVFVALEAFCYYCLNVSYNKEKYIFFADKIIRKSGTIISDSETELVIRNVTHIDMKLPFIEQKLFKTGSIAIESAGSGLSEIYMSSINKPEKIYEHIQDMLKSNGFSLSKTELVQQEKPSTIGVFFETVGGIAGAFLFFIYIVFDFGTEGLSSALSDILPVDLALLFFGALLVLAAVILVSAFRFLDLKNRVYNVYSDTITYSEGFLSRNYSVIPIENLSDSTVTQTLIDKIFGLYDVKISCQGSSQEILFKNMANGPKLESNIDELISKTGSLVGTKTQAAETAQAQGIAGEEVSGTAQEAAYQKHALDRDTTYTSEHKMDSARTLAPLLVLLPFALIFPPLLVVIVILVVLKVIEVGATKYNIKENNMAQRYNFIHSKNVEFANEKITAVIFKENFIDKWFNTCSIHFWSIGSAEDLQFRNIKKSEGLYEAVIAKTGIKPQEKIYEMNPSFSLIDLLKGAFFVSVALVLGVFAFSAGALLFEPLFLAVPVIIIVGFLIFAVYQSVYQNRVNLSFFENYVYCSRGIFFEEVYFVLRDDIKDISTVKYPFSQSGSVQFNIAGERVVQQGKTAVVISNSFKVDFIEDVSSKDELIDLIFYRNPNAQEVKDIERNIQAYVEESTQVLTAKPDVSNTIVVWGVPAVVVTLLFVLFLQFLIPLLLVLPVVVLLAVWSVKVRSFSIEPYRVVEKSGILYKKQTSILFRKIDHLNVNQGMLNKMFGNGNVSVNTTGSSTAELVVVDIPDYREFYDKLKECY